MLERRDSCPACGGSDHVTLLEAPYSDQQVFDFLCAYYRHAGVESVRNQLGDGTLAILECAVCGLMYQRDIPNQDFMQEIYARWVIEGDELAPTAKPLDVEHYAYLASEVLHLLTEQRLIVGSERRLRVLDFGMGWSTWLQFARSFGATVYGADLSEPKIAFARSLGIPVLSLAEISAMRFDLICTEQVFEHVPHPASLLETLAASLAPSGYLKISVPPGRTVKALLSRWRWKDAITRQDELMPVQPLEHINCFTSRSLDAFAARHGLERAPISPWRAIACSFGWLSARSALKNVLRPLYRFALKKGTYAVYRHRIGDV